MNKKAKPIIAVLAGDGIGHEVMAEALKVLEVVARLHQLQFDLRPAWFGGEAIDRFGTPLPAQTQELCQSAGAILLASVGGPKWDALPPEQRPEIGGLLALRRQLDLYANIRPAFLFDELKDISPLALREGSGRVDLVIVRELSSGIYLGQPKTMSNDEAVDTLRYRREEIERVAHVAFAMATKRRGKVTSVDKANVLYSSMLWRRVVAEVAQGYPGVELNHLYVDNTAMQLVLKPQQFDVILTENMFGDILSDEAAALCGSLGLLPSASLGSRVHLYEPAGGSAPDIAGQGIANPIAQILCVALMLEYSFQEIRAARAVDDAVRQIILSGGRTSDIAPDPKRAMSTSEMGSAIAAAVR